MSHVMPGRAILAADASAVNAAARSVRDTVDVEEIARVCHLGLEETDDLPAGCQGVYVMSGGRRILRLNCRNPLDLRRLTIAHALAHVRYGDRAACAINTIGFDSEDLRAGYYGGHLLIPDELLGPILGGCDRDQPGIIALLSCRFSVPYEMMHWRMIELSSLAVPVTEVMAVSVSQAG